MVELGCRVCVIVNQWFPEFYWLESSDVAIIFSYWSDMLSLFWSPPPLLGLVSERDPLQTGLGKLFGKLTSSQSPGAIVLLTDVFNSHLSRSCYTMIHITFGEESIITWQVIVYLMHRDRFFHWSCLNEIYCYKISVGSRAMLIRVGHRLSNQT